MASLRDTLANLVEQYKASDTPLANLMRGDKEGAKQAVVNALQQATQDPYSGLNVLGTTKLVGKTAQELAHEVAQKNAVEMLGLPEGNTAMQRARAMGYDTAPSNRLYHYAKQDWQSNVIDPTRSDLGFHVGNVEQAGHRAKIFGGGLTSSGEWVNGLGEGSNIIPLVQSKYSYMLPIKDEGSFHADAIAHQLEKKGVLPKGYIKEAIADPLGDISPAGWDVKYDQAMRDALEKKGYHGVKYKNTHEGEGVSYAFTDPSMLRSPFAAFDPARRGENDILAGAMALPIATDKDKRNKIIDLLKNK